MKKVKRGERGKFVLSWETYVFLGETFFYILVFNGLVI